MAINWALIKADVLRQVYDASVQYEKIYRTKQIEDISSFSGELVVTAIKKLEEDNLVKIIKEEDLVEITNEGKKFVKDAIEKSLG